MPEFKIDFTDVPLVLRQDGTRITLEGDKVKILYDGTSQPDAKSVYDYTKDHYDARKAAQDEDKRKGNRESEEEKRVGYKRQKAK